MVFLKVRLKNCPLKVLKVRLKLWFSKQSFLKPKLFVSLTIVKDVPSLTIVNDDPPLTIFNDESGNRP